MARTVRKPSEYARSWWARRWLEPLDELGESFAPQVRNGRSLAQSGMVKSTVRAGGADAEVRDTSWNPRTHQPRLVVETFLPQTWDEVITALGGEALMVARLFAGEATPELEEVFMRAGVSLLPTRHGEVRSSCTCADYQHPCKHVVALYYAIANDLEHNPLLLFTLRGRPAEQVAQAVRSRWAAELAGSEPSTGMPATAAPDAAAPDEGDKIDAQSASLQGTGEAEEAHTPLRAHNFFTPGAALDDFAISAEGPPMEGATLKRLGQPPFAAEHEQVEAILAPIYELVTQKALQAFATSARKRKKK
ncbi:MAG: SWIM zinc finger family protein [Ktedonobacterales bacterium]